MKKYFDHDVLIVTHEETEILVRPGKAGILRSLIKINEPEFLGTGPYKALAYLNDDERVEVIAALLETTSERVEAFIASLGLIAREQDQEGAEHDD